MTTTIGPALGHGPLTQQGTGSTPGYDAIDARRWMSDPDMGEGVTTYGSYRVSQRAAGVNLSVDINMDDFAYVRGDAVTLQGLYKAAPHASTINEAISAADATNPRIDRVILELKDTAHDASGSSLFQTRVVTGTPTGGATLDNLTGAGAVPSSALLLADVLVAATDTAISDSEIRDRRAFGATALTGNYVLGIYDASGRKIIDTGSVALTGAASSAQARSETISATTFEPGLYYALFGIDTTNAGAIRFPGYRLYSSTTAGGSPVAKNMGLFLNSGGVTAPSTVLGFSDIVGTAPPGATWTPAMALSVG
jgi:hypothetical protein